MLERDAIKLQQHIYVAYPHLPIVIRTLGDDKYKEYVCFIETECYYLWSTEDWYDYKSTHNGRLQQYLAPNKRLTSKRKHRKVNLVEQLENIS